MNEVLRGTHQPYTYVRKHARNTKNTEETGSYGLRVILIEQEIL